MRFPTGTVDQYLPFVAVDETDGATLLSGLSSWTVYRSRNGAAAVAYGSPTIVERRPGLYWLLLDEDMDIDSGDDEQAVAIEVRHTGMQTVLTGFELFRPKATVGETVTASGGGVTLTAADKATLVDLTLNESTTGHATAGTLGAHVTAASNQTSASSIRIALGLATGDMDDQFAALPTAAENAAAALAALNTTSVPGSPTAGTYAERLSKIQAAGTVATSAEVTDAVALGSTQPRVNDDAGRAYQLDLVSMADGTYKAVGRTSKAVRLRPGEVNSIAVQVYTGKVFGSVKVLTVHAPTVSGGSITATELGPRDAPDPSAMVLLDGTATAGEERTCTFDITMRTGERVPVTFDIEVFSD